MKRLKRQFNDILKFFTMMIPDRKKHIFIAFFAGLSDLFFYLITAFILRGVYEAITIADKTHMYKTIWFFMLMTAGTFIYNFICWRSYGSSAIRITGKIRLQIISKLCMLRLSDVEKGHSGDFMSLLTNDLNTAESVYLNIRLILSSLSLGIISTILVLKTSWLMGAAIALFALFQLLINLYVIKPLESESIKIRENTTNINSTFSDLLRNNVAIRLNCSKEFYFNMSKGIIHSLYKAKMKLHIINSLVLGINVCFGLLGYIVVLLIGGYLIGYGSLNLPDLLFITQLRLMMTQGILILGNNAVQLQPAIVSIRKILLFMDNDIEESA